MKNKKIFNLVLFVLLISMALVIFLLLTEREANKLELQKTKQEIKLKDSIANFKIKRYLSIIENNNDKIDSLTMINNDHSVTGFTIGSKSISVEELLKIVNTTLEENDELRKQTNIDKQIVDFINKKYGITVDTSGEKIVFKVSPESSLKFGEKECNKKLKEIQNELDEKKHILKSLENRYKFKYDLKTEGNYIKSTIYNTKVDSALWLYPYYKHKIKTDKQGNLIIK
jgi:hypothetical protein